MKRFYLVLVVFIGLVGCTQLTPEEKREMRLKTITNNFTDVVVVCDSVLWMDSVGVLVQGIFDELYPVEIYPAEKQFNLVHKNSKKELNDFEYRSPNIMYIAVDDDKPSAVFDMEQGKNIKQQQVYTLYGKKEDIIDYLSNYGESLVLAMNEHQISRNITQILMRPSYEIRDSLSRKFGIKMKIEGGFSLYGSNGNHVLLGKDSKEYVTGQGNMQLDKRIVVFSEPRNGREELPNYSDILHKVDSVFATNLKTGGGLQRGYARVVNHEEIQPTQEEFSMAEQNTILVRGNWNSEGAGEAIGGPFLATVFDGKRGSFIYVVTYMYAPTLTKADKLRMFEASLKSMEILQ